MKIVIDEKMKDFNIYNPRIKKKILKVLIRLASSQNLAKSHFPKIHLLDGSKYGQFSLPITGNVKLLFVPSLDVSNDNDKKSFAIFNKSNITEIKIIGITFDHYRHTRSS